MNSLPVVKGNQISCEKNHENLCDKKIVKCKIRKFHFNNKSI